MTFEEARQIIVAAINGVGNALHNPRLASRLDDPGQDVAIDEFDLDSLTTIEVCMAVEEQVGIEFDPGDLAQFASLNEFARAVAERARR